MARTRIFVSYSHDDGEWLNRFLQHIAVLQRKGVVDVWSDKRIEPGAPWEKEIETALTAAKVAVLLVSPAFLDAEYIWEHEMPRIIAHCAQGMKALPLIVRPCAWRLVEDLARLQARPENGRPLSLGSPGQVDLDLSALAYELAAMIGKSPAAGIESDPSAPFRDSPQRDPAASDPTGEWAGYYNQTRSLRLVIREKKGNAFYGTMQYPGEGTTTIVEGAIHEQWSPSDPIWAQINRAGDNGHRFAVSFRETSYKTKGSSSISFEGEYHAIVSGSVMTGAWFSGNRLVGAVTLQRKSPPRMNKRK